ncbi:DUF7535 family protein [Halococcus salsus]|uniref:DUF7535 family protein n=1 Tax=Halococcus salsus TaxID=2162894 RepID=UPI001358A1E0|nr:hypothetical protein [Halococcus salsus]
MSSDGDAAEDDSGIRTVTPLSRPHGNTEMDVIGWGIFVLLFVVALPVIPLFVVYWLLDRALGSGDRPEEATG